MNEDEFWTLIGATTAQAADREGREAYLADRLSRLARPDLLDFVQRLSATREPANTYRLWLAADLLLSGYCSTDGFHYFQMWLVGLGREIYAAAVAEPDSLASVPAVRRLAALPQPWADDDYPEWESLEYVALGVGRNRADIDDDVRDDVENERGVKLRFDPAPIDIEWRDLTTAEVAQRYPGLWSLFGGRWRVD